MGLSIIDVITKTIFYTDIVIYIVLFFLYYHFSGYYTFVTVFTRNFSFMRMFKKLLVSGNLAIYILVLRF